MDCVFYWGEVSGRLRSITLCFIFSCLFFRFVFSFKYCGNVVCGIRWLNYRVFMVVFSKISGDGVVIGENWF